MSACSSFIATSADASDLVNMYRYFKCRNMTAVVDRMEEHAARISAGLQRELPWMVGLASAFALLIILGGLANLALVGALCSRRALRTNAHGLFVLNLACSDLILCLITQPLNLLRLLQVYYGWRYGSFLCKAVNLLTGLNLFVSTFSVSAVALERFRTIVHPSAGPLPKRRCRAVVLAIWGLGLLMASPLGWLAQVTENRLVLTRREWLCIEHTSSFTAGLKVAYSGITLAVQFLIPLLVLAVAHAMISRFLRRRLAGATQSPAGRESVPLVASASISASGQQIQQHQQQQQQQPASDYRRRRCALERRRQFRAKALLVATVAVFAVSWCPLTILNVHLDVQTLLVDNTQQPKQQQQQQKQQQQSPSGSNTGSDAFRVRVAQGVCLMMVLLSACANPLLLGCCNQNLRQEFSKRLFGRGGGQGGQGQRSRQQQQQQPQPRHQHGQVMQSALVFDQMGPQINDKACSSDKIQQEVPLMTADRRHSLSAAAKLDDSDAGRPRSDSR